MFWLLAALTAQALNPVNPVDPRGSELGSKHLRLELGRRTIHVLLAVAPEALEETVVYVHGYYTGVDQAWQDQRLEAQLLGSGRHAMFIVPEAPRGGGESVAWPVLSELLDTVAKATHISPPPKLTAIGHSGAVRTIRGWLGDSRLLQVVLLDAMYGDPAPYGRWLLAEPEHQLALISSTTWSKTEPFCRAFQSRAGQRLSCTRSPLPHMALVEGGTTIPKVLRAD